MSNYLMGDDLLSRSYYEGIRKISRTKDYYSDFHVLKDILEVRKRDWNNFFDKYLKQMSDDIEFNVDTLGLEGINNEEYNNEHRVPISTRKPSALIQYWINTGHPPYKVLFNENNLSDTGSSLSEKSIKVLPRSSAVIEANESSKQEQKSDSSYSSVDTAEYILSNANVTKKSDTIAIIQDAKYDNTVISENVCKNNTVDTYNDRLECIKASKDHIIHNNNSIDGEQCSNAISRFIPVEHLVSKTNIQTSIDTISTNILQKTSENMSFLNAMSTSQQFDRSKEVRSNVRDADSLNQTGISRNRTSDTQQILENSSDNEIEHMTLSQLSSRKRLYTGRSSPVDLIAPKKSNTNRLSDLNEYLHPALSYPYIVEKKTSLINKDRRNFAPKHEKNLAFNKDRAKKKKRSAAFSKKITNIDDKVSIANNNKNSDSTHNFSRNSLDSNNILYKRDNDTASTEYYNINTIGSKITQHNLLSLNLNPIVLLERLPAFVLPSTLEQHESDEHCAGKNNTNSSSKLCSCQIEYLESDTVNSDDSRIIICRSGENNTEFDEHPSSCCFHQTLNSQNDFLSAEKKSRSSNLKDVVINKVAMVVLERLPLLINKGCKNGNVDAKMFNKNYTIHETKILNKSDTGSPNSDDSRKKNNIKLQKQTVDISFKRDNNVINVSSNKKKISHHKDADNTEKKCIIETEVSHKGVKSSTLESSYLLKDTNFRKSNNELNCTSSSNSFFDEVELKSIAQRKNGNKQVENKHEKHSNMNSIVLSDEDNFVELIKQNSHKNSENKVESFNINNDKYHHNRNKNIGTDSSRKVKPIKIDRLIEDQTRRSRKKSVSDSTTSTSLRKKMTFSILSSDSDNSSIAGKLGKRKKRSSLLYRSRNTNNNIKKRTSKDIRRDTTNYKNNNNVPCQTNNKISNIDSSSSEESSIDRTTTCKGLKPSVHNTVCHSRSSERTCLNNPIKKYISKLLIISSSSDENNRTKHKYNIPTKSQESVMSKKEKNRQMGQNKEGFNYRTRSNINNATTENMISFSSIDNISKVGAKKEDGVIINTSNKKDNESSVESTSVKFPKLLRPRRINFYDSDSSESL